MGEGSFDDDSVPPAVKIDMWKMLLKNATIRDVRSLLSPKFFRVFPAAKITAAIRELVGNYRDAEGFDDAVAHRRTMLEATDLPIRLDADAEPEGDVDHDHGDAVLELYFRQFFEGGATLLDLRAERFSVDGELVWSPVALWVEWDETFHDGIRRMYRGFYEEDDAEFERGLEILNLEDVGELLLDHFGGGEQRAVRFDVDEFHDTFNDVLSECDDRDRSLHHQFSALGVYLATLYDHLDALGGTYDVRAAYERAVRGLD